MSESDVCSCSAVGVQYLLHRVCLLGFSNESGLLCGGGRGNQVCHKESRDVDVDVRCEEVYVRDVNVDG